MILQSLVEYYNRKATDPDSGIAPPGWEVKEIPYIIVLDPQGNPVDVVTTVEGNTKKTRRVKTFLVPQGEKKSNGIKSNLIWDNPEYVIGINTENNGEKKHEAFRERIAKIGNVNDPGWKAVQNFVVLSLEEKLAKLKPFECWKMAQDEGANMTFQLVGSSGIVSSSKAVRDAINDYMSSKEGKVGRCLITNKVDPIAMLHTAIKGVWGGQSAGTNIVSFNIDSSESFGKKQGANAPIGKSAAFAYTTALNNLLQKDSQNRMQVGEASTVFWGEQQSTFEDNFPCLFEEPPKDDPDRGVNAVRALYESVQTGAYAEEESANRFFVLGLSPNGARLAIRFWIAATVREMSNNIVQHFEDIKIVHGPNEIDVLSLFRLLVSTATKGKSENIPPLLEGDLMRSILENLPYSHTLLLAVIQRIRAEQKVSYSRAAIIKAYLNRKFRYKNKNLKEDLHVSLDLTNKNIGYRLGRLFAALEKIQTEANPGLNATIRDRFYGAASGTPVTVFPNLMRLKNHHLSKLENAGRRIYFEQLLGEIASEIADFPKHLALDDQGRFAIGYYHQMQHFFTRKNDESDEPSAERIEMQEV